MSNMPQDKAWDSTLALMYDGYRFILNRCERYQSDVFQTRLLLQPTICMRGEEAALIFYDTNRFQQCDALPSRMIKTLLGQGSVLTMDGEAHRNRKQLFMSLQWDESAFNFIPQGGGDHYSGHRCAGEWITLELMKVALRVLTELITYSVPEQNLTVSLSQMPPIPKSRFLIGNVQPKHDIVIPES